MLVCYLDDSGKDAQNPLTTIAGYVASEEAWSSWIASIACTALSAVTAHCRRRTCAQHRPDGKPTRAASQTASPENGTPNHLLVTEPSWSIQGIGGSCGR